MGRDKRFIRDAIRGIRSRGRSAIRSQRGYCRSLAYETLEKRQLLAATPGDFDINGRVDGLDFFAWQRGYPTQNSSTDSQQWEDNYGYTEFQWPFYGPNIAYDFNEEFGPLEPPTKIIPAVSGVEGVYADDWWSFVWRPDKNPIVTDAAWIAPCAVNCQKGPDPPVTKASLTELGGVESGNNCCLYQSAALIPSEH